MGVRRLGISNPTANTSTTIFTSDNQYLLSVIATNKSASSSAVIDVWVQPFGSTSESEYAYIIKGLPIDASNAYETFRFAVNQNDVIRVTSTTASVSFSAYGLVQYDINLGLGLSSYQSASPTSPTQGLIWINSSASAVGTIAKPIYIYDGTQWIGTTSTGIDTTANYNFTGSVSFGNVSSTEISYLDGTTSAIQTQLNNKEKSIPFQSTAPLSPSSSDLWVDSTSMQLKVYNGTTWVALGAAVDDSQLIISQRMFA